MTARKVFGRAAILALVVLAALFTGKFATEDKVGPSAGVGWLNNGTASFEIARKNYASQKQAGGNIAPGEAQKYEKIATIGQSTSSFDSDRGKIGELIADSGGLTQYERQQGLSGYRILQLGIGVPPAKFEHFIEEARMVAKITSLAIVKTDKTGEYRQLRARKETLEKARKALTEMASSGGSIDERLKVQAQLTEVEDKIQDLGVSLGDFTAENEFCTVKLTLAEIGPPQGLSLLVRAFRAMAWALEYFLFLSVGLLLLALALLLATLAADALARAWTRIASD